MTLAEDKKVVKVGMTIHKIGKFQPVDTTVKVNLEIYFTYKKDEIYPIFQKFYKGDNFEQDFKFPFLISNAVDYNEDKLITVIKTNDNNINYHEYTYDESGCNEFILEKYMIQCELEVVNFTQLLPFNKMLIPINIITNGSPGTNKIIFKEEVKIPKYIKKIDDKNKFIFIIRDNNGNYFFRYCDDNIHNSNGIFKITKLDESIESFYLEHNLDYLKFNINEVVEEQKYIISTISNLGKSLSTEIEFENKWETEDISCNENIIKKLDLFNKDDIVWGKFIDDKELNYNSKNISIFTKIKQYFYNSWDWHNIVHPYECVHNDAYSRIYFVLSYSFGIKEDIVKYYFIPIILTINIIVFNSIDLSTFAGLFPTIMLGNIALLFIQPETGKFTFNEKSVHLNIILTILLSCMKVLEIPLYFGTIFWIFVVLFLNLINIIYNMYTSINTINSIDNIIFNNSKINYLEKLFNSEYTEILLDNVEKLDNKKKEEENLKVEEIKKYNIEYESYNRKPTIEMIV